MPVSIVTSLMLWSSLLAPASRGEPIHLAKVDRSVAAHPSGLMRSYPVPEPGSWTLLDAAPEEEEAGDGDPNGLASEAFWLSPRFSLEGRVSPIRRDRTIFRDSARSKILRC